MILYIFVAFVSIILIYESCKQTVVGGNSRAALYSRACIVAVFVLLFGVSACRLNVGNDYGKYVEFMHRLYTDKYIADPGVPTEWGFNLLARVIYGLSGYENYLLVFAIYAFATIGLFFAAMKKQSVDFALTFFMFMTLGYYFQSFSTIRYYLALAIALYCMKFVNEKKWLEFAFFVLIGTGFHKSILVIVPLYLLASIAWKKWQIAIAVLLCSTFLIFHEFYLQLFVKLYPSYEDTEYLAGSGFSWINILRCLAVLMLALIYYKQSVEADRKMLFYFYCNLGALVLYIFGAYMPLVSRIGYYLTISHILFVPALIKDIPNEKRRKIIKIILIVACIMYFAMYLYKASDDGVLVLPYRTFLFNDMVDILSDVQGALD